MAVLIIENKTLDEFIKYVTSPNLRCAKLIDAKIVRGLDVYRTSISEKEKILNRCFAKNRSAVKCYDIFYEKCVKKAKNNENMKNIYKLGRYESEVRVCDVVKTLRNCNQLIDSGINLAVRDKIQRNNFEDIFNDQCSLKFRRLYFTNMIIEGELPRRHLEYSIKNLRTSHIDGRVNNEIGDCPGINSSMFYVGSGYSVTEMHIEDSDLSAFNVVYFNLFEEDRDAPAKLWLIVPDKQKLTDAVAKIFIGKVPCPYVLFHKTIYVTVDFLKEHDIEYNLVPQYPGEVIYVKSGVYHQVLNLTSNFAEAINYGDNAWNAFSDHITYCSCEDRRLTYLRTNPGTISVVKNRQLKMFRCTFSSCNFEIRNLNELRKHFARHRVTEEERNRFLDQYPSYRRKQKHCQTCGVDVVNWFSHKKTAKHLKGSKLYNSTQLIYKAPIEEEQEARNVSIKLRSNTISIDKIIKRCNICNTFIQNSLKRHNMSEKHKKNCEKRKYNETIFINMSCKFCRSCFLDYNSFIHHQKTCSKKIVICHYCKNTFGKKYNLKLHILKMSCNFCEKCFPNHKSLINHKKICLYKIPPFSSL